MHAVWSYLSFIDPFLALLVVLLTAFSFWAGYEFCQARHKQHGIGVDPWSYLIPDDPRDLLGPKLPDPPREEVPR